MARTSLNIRRAFLALHRWVALILFVLLVPVALSGALLVFHDEIDEIVNPARYAVTGKMLLQPSDYLRSAATAIGGDVQIVGMRFPNDDAAPVTVQLRGNSQQGSGPPQFVTVYLDPPTARVLDTLEFRSSFFGFLHRFHENLTIPEYSGRAIVGWVGVAMLFLSLGGIYLWWPRNGTFTRGFRWRRSPDAYNNLHHTLGSWIAIPLALVSLTGVYLSFPPQARNVMSSIAPMTQQAPRAGFGPVIKETALTPERALATATALAPQARPVAIFLPITSREGGGVSQPMWRVQLRSSDEYPLTVTVADATGAARLLPIPLAGDRAALWVRWLHDGSRGGVIWRVVVLATGVFPAVLGVTGIVVWLRRRQRRARLNSGGFPEPLQAAE
jgi:uncharacterized iron-regulated membrane protein